MTISSDDEQQDPCTLAQFKVVLDKYNKEREAYLMGRSNKSPEIPNPPKAFVEQKLSYQTLSMMNLTLENDPPTPLDPTFYQSERFIRRPVSPPPPPEMNLDFGTGIVLVPEEHVRQHQVEEADTTTSRLRSRRLSKSNRVQASQSEDVIS